MNIVIRMIALSLIIFLGSGCATEVVRIKVPEPNFPSVSSGYVKIVSVQDLRKFEKSPGKASSPSIEDDRIGDKSKTDKSIGRMRHGLFHKALWNHTLPVDEDIYSVCRKIVTSSLNSAGYLVVTSESESYADAVPVSIDILQFWAWMQPKFNLELHFDGELKVIAQNGDKHLDVTGQGTDFFSTGFADTAAWEKLVDEGVKNLQLDLTEKLIENLAQSQ